jgi:Zn finger protein HypA/HybF involved in hydrogenase expression
MSESKESCPTKTALLIAWQNAAEIYSKAVAELSRKVGVVSKAEYERLKSAAEAARQRSINAQANLEAHVESHGCDGDGDGEVAA